MLGVASDSFDGFSIARSVLQFMDYVYSLSLSMRCVWHISLPTMWGAAVAATHITLFARERDVSISAVCG